MSGVIQSHFLINEIYPLFSTRFLAFMHEQVLLFSFMHLSIIAFVYYFTLDERNYRDYMSEFGVTTAMRKVYGIVDRVRNNIVNNLSQMVEGEASKIAESVLWFGFVFIMLGSFLRGYYETLNSQESELVDNDGMSLSYEEYRARAIIVFSVIYQTLCYWDKFLELEQKFLDFINEHTSGVHASIARCGFSASWLFVRDEPPALAEAPQI